MEKIEYWKKRSIQIRKDMEELKSLICPPAFKMLKALLELVNKDLEGGIADDILVEQIAFLENYIILKRQLEEKLKCST